MALFAGALVSLAQIVEAVTTDTTSASWQALRTFLYGAIMLNLSGAFLSLVTIKMCSDLTITRRRNPSQSPPGATFEVQTNTVTGNAIRHSRVKTLLDAGMSPGYKFVDISNALVMTSACISTFASLTFWVFLNAKNSVVPGLIMLFFVPAAIIAIAAFWIAALGE
jgi:hypothetical protein